MKVSRWLPFVYALLLLWAGVHYAARIDQALDVGFADETHYLDQGLRLTFENMRTFRAPLYGVWYKALSLIEDDPMALYDVNLRVQVVLLPIALFWALWASGVPPWAAFLLGWAWLLGDANLEPWPRVSAFVWILILGGLGVFMRLKRDWRGWVVLLGSVGLSMYARPEMMLAFGLLLVWAFWRVPRTERRALLIGLGILSVLMGLTFGSPYEPGRLFGAFGQHFAFRWKDRYLPNGLPWNYWEEVLQTAFGPEVHSLADVIRANPRLVVEHIAANAKDTLWRLGKMFFSHTPYVFKKRPFIEGVLWLSVGLLGLGWWWRSRRQVDWRHYRDFGVGVGILALPSATSTVFIYPRYHYLLGLAVLGWYLWGVMVLGSLSRKIEQTFPRSSWAWKGGLAISVLLSLTTPSVVSHFGFRPLL
ncbi:MAG TPA: hypothetical protein G4O04_10375, partial [Anaerolineae bacterium]|nr:hypothetical protein [Anaerolineae bacterium]